MNLLLATLDGERQECIRLTLEGVFGARSLEKMKWSRKASEMSSSKGLCCSSLYVVCVRVRPGVNPVATMWRQEGHRK